MSAITLDDVFAMAKTKRAVAEALLPLCPFVVISKHTTETLPSHIQWKDDALVLRIGRDPQVLGCPDLVLDDDGWSGSLSFSGQIFYCAVRWEFCFQFFVAFPYQGPTVFWHGPLHEEQLARVSPRPGLRLVK